MVKRLAAAAAMYVMFLVGFSFAAWSGPAAAVALYVMAAVVVYNLLWDLDVYAEAQSDHDRRNAMDLDDERRACRTMAAIWPVLFFVWAKHRFFDREEQT